MNIQVYDNDNDSQIRNNATGAAVYIVQSRAFHALCTNQASLY